MSAAMLRAILANRGMSSRSLRRELRYAWLAVGRSRGRQTVNAVSMSEAKQIAEVP